MNNNFFSGKVQSKYNWSQLWIILFFTITLPLVVLIIRVLFSASQTLIGAVVLLGLTVFLISYLLKYFPKIWIDEKGVVFNNLFKKRKYDWEEFKEVQLTGKKPILGQEYEACTLIPATGKPVSFWELNYRNAGEMRHAISHYFYKINPDLAPKKVQAKNLIGIFPITIKGNVFTSFNFLVMAACIGFSIYFAVVEMYKGFQWFPFMFPFAFGVVFSLFFGSQLHYFEVTHSSIIIRHHFWNTHIEIPFKNIQEFVVETPYRRSTSLRVLLCNYESKVFKAGSLRDKHWRQLVELLLPTEIPIRVETYIGRVKGL